MASDGEKKMAHSNPVSTENLTCQICKYYNALALNLYTIEYHREILVGPPDGRCGILHFRKHNTRKSSNLWQLIKKVHLASLHKTDRNLHQKCTQILARQLDVTHNLLVIINFKVYEDLVFVLSRWCSCKY